MTTAQLQIILHTAQLGSISAAAKELDIPQPNASNSIKSVEKEIGFDIFKRDRSGITLTDKGQLFLEHAQRIISETDVIYNLNKFDNICQLRVGCTNYTRGREAFIKFCVKKSGEGTPDLQYYNVSIEDGIQLLYKHKLDILVGVTMESLLPTITEIARGKRLTCRLIDDVYLAITLRKGHPLTVGNISENLSDIHQPHVADSQSPEGGIDIKQLEHYPYVAYHSLNSDFDAPYYKAAFQVPGKYNIYVEEKETRFKLVRDTDAFMLGVKQTQETLDQYNLVEYEYPKIVLNMICIYRNVDEGRAELKEFMELL